MTKALSCITLATLLLAMLGAALANRANHRPPTHNTSTVTHTQPAPADAPAPQRNQVIGAALNLYHTDHLDLYHQSLEQMAHMGFNAVQIVTPIFQDHGGDDVVEIRPGPNRGPAMDDIASLLKHAKRLGLTTMLMPQVNFTSPRGNEWRGKLQPEQWGPWWDSYRTATAQFLKIAIDSDVDIFVVGCELLTTHQPEHEANWRTLIAQCRADFPGQLTYSTTWDTYHKVAFWDALDAVGVSGYWDITTLADDPEQPTATELQQRWVEIRNRLLAYADSQHKPILLTEIGYPSLPWALTKPWNYINNDQLPPDHHAQDQGYTAFIAAWSDTLTPNTNTDDTPAPPDPRARGVFFHKWDPYHQGGPHDTGYGLVGKPAGDTVTRWLNPKPPAP